jgi:hypothetical protein
MEVTFEYADLIVAAATANGYSYQWAVNDVFDPNYTAAGAQPVGFDQWATLYNGFRCVRFEIDTQVSMRTATSSLAVAGSVTPTVPSADYFDVAGSRDSKVSSTTSGAEPARLRFSLDVSKVFGVLPVTVMTDDQYQSTVSGSPARRAIYTVAIETAGATDTISIMQRVRFSTRLERPVVLAVSATRHLMLNPCSALEQRVIRERERYECAPITGAPVPSSSQQGSTVTVSGPANCGCCTGGAREIRPPDRELAGISSRRA